MLGSKVSNLLLAEKNLIDFVEKNLGQERDRLTQNELEQTSVCSWMAGGNLDFPSIVSHDLCDITTALDIYAQAFMKTTTAQIVKPFGHGIYVKSATKNERLSKMPFRGDELSQRQFINAVIQSGLKIRNHIIECTEECISSGRLENLYVIISNVVMIRNYLWTFLEILDVDPASKLKSEYKEFCKLVEVVSEQMLQCQANLLTTYILHDENSQDWSSSQSYYEGQRGSPTVQMFFYFLKAMQRDMWRIMPPKLSQRILAIILNDSLAILTARYSKIQPVASTLPQFICDLSNILATVEELLFHVCADLDQVCSELEPSTSKIIFSIHAKCNCLVTSLVVVGAPLQVLYKTFRRGLSDCNLLEKSNLSEFHLEKPMWLNVLSTLCQKFQPTLNQSDWELVSTLKLLRCQPSMNWSLVYKVLTTNNCRLGTFILNLFPTVQVPANEFLLEGKSFKRCGLASCMSDFCHSLPKSVANHNVHACILYILVHTMPREHFVKAYRPVLSKINDWSIMDNTQVWTKQNRPVWFQAMIDILAPILKTCVQQLCVSIMTEKNPELRENPTQLVVDLLNILTELLSIIPRGFFLICEEIDDMVPSAYYPVRNNVPVHFLVTTLYVLLNLGPGVINSAECIVRSGIQPGVEETKSNISKRIEPLLLATSERLCHLNDTDFDQAIHRLISQIESMMKQTQAQIVKKKSGFSDEFVISNDIAELKADLLLSEVEGQLALRLTYYFLITHGEMLEDVVTGRQQASREKQSTNSQSGGNSKGAKAQEKVSSENPNVKVAPRIRTYSKGPNIVHGFQFVNQFRTFHEILWKIDDLDYVATVRNSRMNLQKSVILKHLEKRPEFAQPQVQEDISLDSSLIENNHGDKNILVGKMVDDIRALMMA